MTRMISFRPDERTDRELRALAGDRQLSEVLRELIHQKYLEYLYAQAATDAERLRHDAADRAEIAAVAEEMGVLRAW
jgi:hypothetical protein